MNKSQKKPELRASALVALSATLYGCLGSLGIKIIDQHLSVPTMLFWRFFIATLYMLGWTIIRRNINIFETFAKAKLLSGIMLAAIFYSVASAFYFLASEQVGTGLAMVVFFTFPIFVVLLSWGIEKKPITKLTVFVLIAIITGILLLKGSGTHHFTKIGIIYALVAALFFGFYVFGSKYIVHHTPSSNLTIFVCLSCTILFLITANIDHTFAFPATFKAWIYIIAMGIIATAMPIQLLLEGVKHLHPNKASILSVLEPVVTVILGILILGETTSAMQMIGALIILCSALCIQFEK